MAMKIFLILIYVHAISCAKILIINQQPYYGHQVISSRLAKDLSENGHEVTIFTTHHFRYDKFLKITQHNFEGVKNLKTDVERKQEPGSGNWLKNFFYVSKLHATLSRIHMKHPEIQKLLRHENTKKYDLMFIECILCQLLAIAEVQKIPVVYTAGADPPNHIHAIFGNDINSAYYPDVLALPYKHGKMSFFKRYNSFLSFHFWRFPGELIFCVNMRVSLFLNDPSISVPCSALYDRVNYLFSFTTPSIGQVRPMVANTAQVAFYNVEKAGKLPESKLKSFLDGSRNGVIYISFGSEGGPSHLKKETMEVFTSVFSKLSYDVLWKMDNSSVVLSKNILAIKDVPQVEVLSHPSVKLFITHGGMRSIEESIHYHVPMIVMPLARDQYATSYMLEDREVAKRLDINSLDERTLARIIEEMMNPIYKENVKEMEKYVYDRLGINSPVWLTNYILKHKGVEYLKYPGRKVPYYQRQFFDIYLFFGVLAYIGIKVYKFARKVYLKAKERKNREKAVANGTSNSEPVNKDKVE